MSPQPLQLPSDAEFAQAIGPIEPYTGNESRPFWSVMIPTYNRAEYLVEAIESVLAQAPGPDRMQIEVVDNCSDKVDVQQITKEVGRGRVDYFRQPENVGYVNNMNTCIRRSRGHWVHILHDDDQVLPGFYAEYKRVLDGHPDLVMLFGQVLIMDESSRWTRIIGHLPPVVGVELPDFVALEAKENIVFFPSAVVKRSAYERVGGFSRIYLRYHDWDLWLRVGLAGRVGMVDRPYALWRIYPGNGGNPGRITADDARDGWLFTHLNVNRGIHPGTIDGRPWREGLSNIAIHEGYELGRGGSSLGRLNQARWAWRLAPSRRTFWFLARSLIKHYLPKRPATSNH